MNIDLSNQTITAMLVFSLMVIALSLAILAGGKLERQAKGSKIDKTKKKN